MEEWGKGVLKMNFSVGVSMYSEKVTSYWYFLSWSHRMREEMVVSEGLRERSAGSVWAMFAIGKRWEEERWLRRSR
jgi:hypothetical protein